MYRLAIRAENKKTPTSLTVSGISNAFNSFLILYNSVTKVPEILHENSGSEPNDTEWITNLLSGFFSTAISARLRSCHVLSSVSLYPCQTIPSTPLCRERETRKLRREDSSHNEHVVLSSGVDDIIPDHFLLTNWPVNANHSSAIVRHSLEILSKTRKRVNRITAGPAFEITHISIKHDTNIRRTKQIWSQRSSQKLATDRWNSEQLVQENQLPQPAVKSIGGTPPLVTWHGWNLDVVSNFTKLGIIRVASTAYGYQGQKSPQ